MSVQAPDPSFSIIAPAYNNPREVQKLLDSIRPEYERDRSLETIIVDDCSREGSLRDVVAESGFARYIRLEENSGPAAARNAGAKAAGNEILLFVDSDVVFNPDTLSRIREKFKDPAVEIFGGEYDVEPANPTLATRFKSVMVRSWIPPGNTVTVFLTRLGAIKKSLFESAGGFDVGLRTASVEDYELGRRLMAEGHTIHYDPAVMVKHHFPTFRNQIKLFFHRSFMWMYIFKKHGKFDNTCTTPLLGISQLCAFFAVLLLPGSFFQIDFLYGSLGMLILFLATNARFFVLTTRYGGPLFTCAAIPMAVVIACSIVAGGAWGAVYFTFFDLAKKGRGQ
ncbi:MAG: glycosyltransferase [Candidatus Omnitrophota bacterium]